MNDKIDIHGRRRAYERQLELLELDEHMNSCDKESIRNFIWDCRIGKTKTGKRGKKVGVARRLKYIQALRTISKWFGKPFKEVTEKDMERVVFDLEEDRINNNGKDYSEETKADFKKAIRKFYIWLNKGNMVQFIDLTVTPKDVPALTRKEITTMINSTPDPAMKAMVIMLFDGGMRIEEFLNIRIKDITLERYRNGEVFWVDIRYSKTFARRFPLPLCKECLSRWLNEHPDKDNPDALLFPYKYASVRRRLGTLARRAIKKRVYPHMLRHSSATYWASRMNRQQLCVKFGWSFSSRMPDKYIKRKGIIFDQIAEQGDTEQKSKLEQENQALRDKLGDFQEQYDRLSQALDLILPIIADDMDGFKTKLLQQRITQLRGHDNQRLKGHLRMW